MHRDGLALVASSGLTSLVGLLYWVLAARLFEPGVVGLNSTALATMMLLGGVAHLNLTYALLRFVPVAGAGARRLVLRSYLVACTVAAAAGAAFALGAGIWAPELDTAAGRWPLVLFFAVATPVWSLFVLQDFVLTALRRATLVPVENVAFSVLKIATLLAAAGLALTGGIALSWVLSTVLLVVVVNGWLLLRALPAHQRAAAAPSVTVTRADLLRFVRADYAGAVFWQAALFGLPLVVLLRLGPEEAAAYGVAWTIAQSLYLVSSGMGQSMVAHSAADAGGVEAARRAMVRRALVLVVPAAVAIAALAPWLLAVFGSHYREYGSTALALAALSAVPNVVTASAVNAARVRQRTGVLFAVPTTVSVLVIGASWVLMPVLGITAVGLAWLAAQVLVALGILVVTAPWLPPQLGAPLAAVRSALLLRRLGATPLREAGVPDPERWSVRERMSGGSDSVVVRVAPDDHPGALLKACAGDRGAEQLGRQVVALAALRADDRLRTWRPFLPEVLSAGAVGHDYYCLESLLPGRGGEDALTDPAQRQVLLPSALAVIGRLHRSTGEPVTVGDAEIERWVRAPLRAFRPVLNRALRADARALEAELDRRLRGRRPAVGWTHGDYGEVNVLVAPDGEVTSVIDWCNAHPDGLQVLDVVCFLTSAGRAVGGRQLGDEVLAWLDEGPSPGDAALLDRAQRELGGDPLDARTLAVLGWLQHTEHNLAKSAGFAGNPVWVRRNVRAVVRGAVRALRRDAPVTGA